MVVPSTWMRSKLSTRGDQRVPAGHQQPQVGVARSRPPDAAHTGGPERGPRRRTACPGPGPLPLTNDKPHQQRADQPRPAGHGQGVHPARLEARLLQGQRDHRLDGLDVPAGGDLRHHPVVGAVQLLLGGHDAAEDPAPVLHDRGGALVAGGLHAQHRSWPAPAFRGQDAGSHQLHPLARQLREQAPASSPASSTFCTCPMSTALPRACAMRTPCLRASVDVRGGVLVVQEHVALQQAHSQLRPARSGPRVSAVVLLSRKNSPRPRRKPSTTPMTRRSAVAREPMWLFSAHRLREAARGFRSSSSSISRSLWLVSTAPGPGFVPPEGSMGRCTSSSLPAAAISRAGFPLCGRSGSTEKARGYGSVRNALRPGQAVAHVVDDDGHAGCPAPSGRAARPATGGSGSEGQGSFSGTG